MNKKLEKRKVLFFLPLIVLPFVALGFYALGGGQSSMGEDAVKAKGINLVLPDAQFKKEEPAGKMDIYKQAAQDTASNNSGNGTDGLDALAFKLGYPAPASEQTKQIEDRLSAINREINNPYVAPKPAGEVVQVKDGTSQSMTKDVEKLEMLMKSMKKGNGEDPEMKQLSGILQSIQEIQNPELARQKYPAKPVAQPDSLFRALPAVIAEDQRVVQGAVVKIRLLDSVVLNAHVVPKGHEIFGLAEFSNQRLNLEIRNIRLGNQIIPVNLTVFDKRDAMKGINAPEAVLTDALNTGSVDAVGSVELGFDQSLGTQIAGAGIDAAKSLFSKRLKRVKQKLKRGYPLLLRDNTKKIK